MTEKELYLRTWEQEHTTTAKILKAYPADKADLKPAEKSKNAKELAWIFVMEQSAMISGVIRGQIDFQNQPQIPASFQEIISKFEADYPKLAASVHEMSEADWNSSMDFFVGPKQMGKVRKGDILWTALHDMIHHRGQLSVYVRIAGAKLPSIYGPTADEPWM